jgi:hypothetical protein
MAKTGPDGRPDLVLLTARQGSGHGELVQGTELDSTWTLALPDSEGGTCCSVWVQTGPGGTTAVVTELPDNPGRSVAVSFPHLARRVRALLPADLDEPLWLRRWPGSGLADMVFRGRPGCDTHLMTDTPNGWVSRPLGEAAANQLMAILVRRSPSTGCTGPKG